MGKSKFWFYYLHYYFGYKYSQWERVSFDFIIYITIFGYKYSQWERVSFSIIIFITLTIIVIALKSLQTFETNQKYLAMSRYIITQV